METAIFFTHVRSKLGPLKQSQVEGFNFILAAIAGSPLAFASYELATTWHETKATMQPVREAFWLSEKWRKANLRYYPWYGRGYVQLTWERNYALADAKCAAVGLCQPGEILASPDKVMEPAISAYVLRIGMEEGWFTGVKLSTVLPLKGVATRAEYMNARTIINGSDKADLIEDYAQIFEKAFRLAGWA